MSLYTSGRSDTYFPDALTFSPKRWLREGGSYQGVTEATASLPFAMGGRSCIGRKMAEAEFTLTLAHVCCHSLITCTLLVPHHSCCGAPYLEDTAVNYIQIKLFGC